MRKLWFALPSAFTVAGVFCGFYAIVLSTEDGSPALGRSATAIFLAMVFDMFDGRVARLTGTQSEFGVQLDSLADLVSFGVAPAIVVYRWALQDLGLLGLVVAFGFVASSALRLARFNVAARRAVGPAKYFLGLPTPLAAGVVVAAVLSSDPRAVITPGGRLAIALMMVTLAGLMVSSIHYRTFKNLRPSRKTVALVFLLAVIVVALGLSFEPSMALAVVLVVYVTIGPLEEAFLFRKRWLSTLTHDDDELPSEIDSEPAPPESLPG